MQATATTAPTVLKCKKNWLERARGPIAILILAPFAAAGLFSDPWIPQSTLTSMIFESLGWTIFVAGVCFRFWSTLYIGGHKGKQLVTEGPYSLCRNPLYLGNLLLTLSIAFFMESLLFAVGLLIASLVFALATISSEERRLGERMGAEYAHYLRTVPRLLPSFRNFHESGTIEVDVRCLHIEAHRALRYLWIPLICHVLDPIRDQSWWPQLFNYLP
jgi:protein-S-isoprenylcysteine O-methyltransferase Ste14